VGREGIHEGGDKHRSQNVILDKLGLTKTTKAGERGK